MVEGQVDDFPVVDAQSEEGVLVILVGHFEVVALLGWQLHQHSRIGCFLLEVRLLGAHRNHTVLIFRVVQGKHLHIQFSQGSYIGCSYMQVYR